MSARESMPLSPGTRLGPYQIVSAIGAGGMGEVYKARDTRLDRMVAIKVLPQTLASDPTFRERFDREAKSISALNHPYICALYDVGRENGVEFLVMEYLDGETLASRLVRGPLSVQDGLRHAIEIASALDRAHRQGIIHRDLKPGNVILTKSGAKLLDFGLAKSGSPGVAAGTVATTLATSPGPLTAQGTILGTLQYMAPEQVEGRESDARSDIFAFGAMLYEMLTGTKAFEGRTHASLIAAILGKEPAPISNAQPLTPPPVERVVRKCLAKDPDDRWQSAKDLADELTWIAQTPSSRGSDGAVGKPAAGRARRAWPIAAGIVLTLAAVTVAVLALQRQPPEPETMRFEIATPPTGDPISFALSPDGRQLVYVARGATGLQIWLRPLDQIAAQPLAGTENASYPFWSPDNRSVGFFADGKLKRIDVPGGAPLVLADATAGRGGTWNRDGVILFAPTTQSGLYRVPSGGGSPEAVTRLAPGQGGHRWPQFLPDGRRFLFAISLGPQDINGTYLGSLDGAEPHRILEGDNAAVFAPPDSLLAARQGNLMAWRVDPATMAVQGDPVRIATALGDIGVSRAAFSVSTTGLLAHRGGVGQRRQLVWFDRTGRRLGEATAPDETSISSPELAPTGRQVAVYRYLQSSNDIWLIDLNRGVPTRFTFTPTGETSPLWSPDGSRIIFASSRAGAYDVFEKPAAGSAEEQPLLVTQQNKTPLSWVSGGEYLLYRITDPKTGFDLWVLPLAGDRKPVPFAQASYSESEGQFSPDGRWIAYASNESGRVEVYVRPFGQHGGKWQISTSGGSQIRWRRDGKELFFVAQDGKLMAASVSAAPNARTIEIGEPAPLFTPAFPSGANITGAKPQYSVAADGRFLINVALSDVTSVPITVVVNWEASARK